VSVHAVVRRYGILGLPNVVGYSNQLMPRIRRGRVVPEELCLRVYVSRKVPEGMLKPSEVVPKSVRLEDGREVCTDVVEVGVLTKVDLLDPKRRWRPSPAGVSTSRADERGAGTLGWYVVDEDGGVYAISNNHVWARENSASPGDRLVQPGVLDGGDPEKDVVLLLYDFVPLRFGGDTNTVDLAVASMPDPAQLYQSILNIGGVTGKRVPSLGETVRKMGRSTGLGEGTVVDTSATVHVYYDRGVAVFTDVMLVEGAVKAGDSGSPVLTANNEFAGLLFAGSDVGDLYVACKYTNIEQELTQRLGRKVRVLVANAYPPFRTEREVQVVYKDNLQAILMFGVAALMLVSVYSTVRATFEGT